MEISQFEATLTTITVVGDGRYKCPQCGREDGKEKFMYQEFCDEWKRPKYRGFLHLDTGCFCLIVCPELEEKEKL